MLEAGKEGKLSHARSSTLPEKWTEANGVKSAESAYFVPEGQHDSSQARSAWSHEENSPVPAGRLNGSRLRQQKRKKCVIHEIPEYNPAMANTFCSLNIHCIFSTKERVPMLKPELRERLWPFLGGMPNKTVSCPEASAGLQTTLICCCHCQPQFRSPKHSINKGWIIGLDPPDFSTTGQL